MIAFICGIIAYTDAFIYKKGPGGASDGKDGVFYYKYIILKEGTDGSRRRGRRCY